MIDVNIETLKSPAGSAAEVSVIRVVGEIDATNAAIVQQKVLPLSVPIVEPCALCEGTGRIGFLLCEACAGQGSAQVDASVHVVIPRHVADGTTMPISLAHLGIRNLYLNLQIRVASGGPFYA